MKNREINDEILSVNDYVVINGRTKRHEPKPIYQVVKTHYNHRRTTNKGSYERDQSKATLRLIYIPKEYVDKRIAITRHVSMSSLIIINKPTKNDLRGYLKLILIKANREIANKSRYLMERRNDL